MTIQTEREREEVVKMIAASNGELSVKAKPAQGASIIEKGPIRIVITDSPTDFNIDSYIKDLNRLNVKHVVRACEPTYNTSALKENKIEVHELAYSDGDSPPEHIIDYWLLLVETCFFKERRVLSKKEQAKRPTIPSSVTLLKDDEHISVHCVAGLGRAPVLVAIALIEFCKMEAFDAVAFIRRHRRGAINKKQFEWLESYQPKNRPVTCFSGCTIA